MRRSLSDNFRAGNRYSRVSFGFAIVFCEVIDEFSSPISFLLVQIPHFDNCVRRFAAVLRAFRQSLRVLTDVLHTHIPVNKFGMSDKPKISGSSDFGFNGNIGTPGSAYWTIQDNFHSSRTLGDLFYLGFHCNRSQVTEDLRAFLEEIRGFDLFCGASIWRFQSVYESQVTKKQGRTENGRETTRWACDASHHAVIGACCWIQTRSNSHKSWPNPFHHLHFTHYCPIGSWHCAAQCKKGWEFDASLKAPPVPELLPLSQRLFHRRAPALRDKS